MQLNPSEISDLIKSRIQNLQLAASSRNEGTVVSVTDGITRIHGLTGVMQGEMLEFPGNTFGLALNLERDSVGAVVLGEYEHITEGDTVKATGRILEVPVGPELIGRVVNALGQPIDGKGPIDAKLTDKIEKVAPGVIARQSVSQPVQTGLKSVDSIIGPGDPIVVSNFLLAGIKTCTSGFCDNTHEPELAFIIGRRARNVAEADAMDYVLGYTIHNDVSGRTLPTGRTGTEGSSMTKGIRTFGPTGPYITLKEDVPDPYNLGIVARVNGQVVNIPNGNTKYMVHRIAKAVAMLSRIMTLEPGDIVATGVPDPDTALTVGDTIEAAVERLGTLRNPVVGEGT